MPSHANGRVSDTSEHQRSEMRGVTVCHLDLNAFVSLSECEASTGHYFNYIQSANLYLGPKLKMPVTTS